MSRRDADLLLVAATLIWGVTFVVIKDALTTATPLAFLAVRFAVAAVVLTPFTPLAAPFTRAELVAGAVLAAVLGVGFATQAVGLVDTTPSRSALAAQPVGPPRPAARRGRDVPAHRPARRRAQSR
ncbi:MAG: hypothetical protein AUI55_07600 [Gemmatimonadetes bacterium 13_1_40CM_2_70_7]|nr:MAG: hypothetical protein AUI55_07600 [Gemmatimonadetes bacterium 13_1_40CM_2_70_7]